MKQSKSFNKIYKIFYSGQSPKPQQKSVSKKSQMVLQFGSNINDFELEIGEGKNLTGNLKINGIPNVSPGGIIELLGFGDKFDGKVSVTKVVHLAKRMNWTTKLFIKRLN